MLVFKNKQIPGLNNLTTDVYVKIRNQSAFEKMEGQTGISIGKLEKFVKFSLQMFFMNGHEKQELSIRGLVTRFKLNTAIDAPNTWRQNYLHLRTLSFFKDAVRIIYVSNWLDFTESGEMLDISDIVVIDKIEYVNKTGKYTQQDPFLDLINWEQIK